MKTTEPVIFDSEDRSNPRTWENMEMVYDSPDNNTLMFLNELPGRYGAFLRDMSHRWLWAMPDDGAAIAERVNPDGQGRKYEGIKNDWEFRLCWWQMFTNQVFSSKASSSELLDIGADCLEGVRYHTDGSEPVMVGCSFVHEHEEQLAIEQKEWEYKSLLREILSGAGMMATFWIDHEDTPPPEWAVREAAEYCLASPLGGKVDIFYDGKQSIITDQEFRRHQSSSTLRVTPSKSGESVVDVSVIRTYSGDSKHLGQIEEALEKIDWQRIGGDAFILCVSTNLMRQIFDVPAVYRTLYDREDSIFMSGKWDRVSGILIGSPLPWYLPNTFPHEVSLTLFLNPHARNQIPKEMLLGMPYAVDTAETQIHHGRSGTTNPAVPLEEYLKGEDFDLWTELREENDREHDAHRFPPLPAEISAAVETALAEHPPLSDEEREWLDEIGILEICANAGERLPWGGSANVEISSPSHAVLDTEFSSQRFAVLLTLDITRKHCFISISMTSIGQTISSHNYDMTLRPTLWEAIAYIHKILNPELPDRSYLRWTSLAHPLPEATAETINSILSLHLERKEVATPYISAGGDSLMADWRMPQHAIMLMADLCDNGKAVWLDHNTGTRREFPVDDTAGWEDLLAYLKAIRPLTPLG